MFWQLQYGFPGDSRFNADNFANQELSLISEAYQQLLILQVEEAHRLTGPVAHFALAMMKVNGQKKASLDWFTAYPDVLLKHRAKREIDPEAARLFLAAIEGDICPAWARSRIDRDLLIAASEG